uniref:Uncharacterized protein n=1 Tax=Arundo donax TaxID=35708 RepID=A0A0A9GIQ1_ARUDO
MNRFSWANESKKAPRRLSIQFELTATGIQSISSPPLLLRRSRFLSCARHRSSPSNELDQRGPGWNRSSMFSLFSSILFLFSFRVLDGIELDLRSCFCFLFSFSFPCEQILQLLIASQHGCDCIVNFSVFPNP